MKELTLNEIFNPTNDKEVGKMKIGVFNIGVGTESLHELAMILKKRNEESKVVVIDYTQLVKPFDLKKREEITKSAMEFMDRLTKLAKDNGITVYKDNTDERLDL